MKPNIVKKIGVGEYETLMRGILENGMSQFIGDYSQNMRNMLSAATGEFLDKMESGKIGVEILGWNDVTYNLRAGIGIGIYNHRGELADFKSTKPRHFGKLTKSNYLFFESSKTFDKTVYTFTTRGGGKAEWDEMPDAKFVKCGKLSSVKTSVTQATELTHEKTDGAQLLKMAIDAASGKYKLDKEGYTCVLFSAVPYGDHLNMGQPNKDGDYAGWYKRLKNVFWQHIHKYTATHYLKVVGGRKTKTKGYRTRQIKKDTGRIYQRQFRKMYTEITGKAPPSGDGIAPNLNFG